MSRNKAGFVTLCQQVLALAVVLAVLVPAAGVVTLDIVREQPSDGAASPTPAVSGALAAYVREAQRASTVATAPADPEVREIALTPPAAAAARATGAAARLGRLAGGPVQARITTRRTVEGLARVVTSTPQRVTGYGAVGVTWAHGEDISETDLTFRVRTRTDGVWGRWLTLPYHDDHGPDPGSAEAKRARPGTDPLLIGTVDDVQVRATATGDIEVPDDMTLAVIDPGTTPTATEKAGIDTATMDGDDGSDSIDNLDVGPASTDSDAASLASADTATPAAAVFTPKPVIYSRAQWGADESLREKSSLHYYEVHAGFVHHTVNANDYTRAEVPGIIRSIYAYHVKSRGWSDIGYNFLVDRFGRVWEGRYGGVDRPVVGAHTLDYNDYSFAMSAIGNYDVKEPSEAIVEAYGALFAWKLSLHGVSAGSTSQKVGATTFEAINGHRDAASTACPGRYLYARIPDIRRIAAQAQRGWAGRQLESDLAATPYPDLVVRRASDKRLFIVPTGGLSGFSAGKAVAGDWSDVSAVQVSPDLSGDGAADLVVRTASGTVKVHRGDGEGGFAAAGQKLSGFSGHDLVTAAGDLDGDGRNDLVARNSETGRLDLFRGRKPGAEKPANAVAFAKKRTLEGEWADVTELAGAGDLDGDGRDDLALVRGTGALAWARSTGDGYATPSGISVSSAVQDVAGRGDVSGDGVADLVVRTRSGAAYAVLGRGDGTFGRLIGPFAALAKAGGLVGGGDVAGNAMPDLYSLSGGRLLLYQNRGTFNAGAPLDTGVTAPDADVVLTAGDWDRDGFGDVVLRSAKTGRLLLRRGDGEGHLGTATVLAQDFSKVKLLAAVGDMTGDGWPDLMGQPAGGSMRIYPGRGLDGLGTSYAAHSAISASRQIGIGRYDADGAPDSLFRKGSTVTLYPGNGPGGLMDPTKLKLDLSPYDWSVGISSATLGTRPALLARRSGTGDLYLIPATASGFGTPRLLTQGMGVYDLAG